MLAPLLLVMQATLLVGPGERHTTVTAAVAAAAAGDTVVVTAGRYAEPTIHIFRPITLLGRPGATLDGEGSHEIVLVEAPGVTISGLRFINTGTSYREDRAALRVAETSDCLVSGNRFEETFFAIYLQRTVDCVVEDNTIVGTPGREVVTGNGIHSWGSTGLVVRDNRASGHRDGIYFEFTTNAIVERNVSEGNRRYGMHFMFSDSSRYIDNTFRGNGSGVAVMYSKAVLLRGNRFEGSHGPASYGLLLKDVTDSRLEANQFIGNTAALVADGADRVEILGNTFRANGWAVRLLASTSGGHFLGNAFVGNTFSLVVNGRGTSASFEGNYWDDYQGWDLDRDGVGDIAHHPVRLFALLVGRGESALLLHRSLFVRLLDAAERAIPVLTPDDVLDHRPLMRPPAGGAE
jgi:nitrous oxidase accessory protein